MELPRDMLSDIFCRLPASVILTCSKNPSLSRKKEFNDIVYDPNFAHLFQSYTNVHPCSFLAWDDTGTIFLVEYHVGTCDIVTTKLNMDFLGENSMIHVMASCNGWLLVRERLLDQQGRCIDNLLRLINPITRNCKNIPCNGSSADYGSMKDYCYCLGYNPETHQYKVVRFAPNSYEVLTVGPNNNNNNMCWRVIDAENDSYYQQYSKEIIEFYGGPVMSNNGALHWLVDDKSKILKFDIDKEEFELGFTPFSIGEPHNGAYLGIALHGSLCMGAYTFSNGLEVWVMNEYGVEESWTRLTSIDNFNLPEPLKFLSIFGNDKLLIFSQEDKENKLHVYDFEKKNEEKFTMMPMLDELTRANFTIAQIVPSFLSLRG